MIPLGDQDGPCSVLEPSWRASSSADLANSLWQRSTEVSHVPLFVSLATDVKEDLNVAQNDFLVGEETVDESDDWVDIDCDDGEMKYVEEVAQQLRDIVYVHYDRVLPHEVCLHDVPPF